MQTTWHFFAVRASTPSGFTWQWQKERRDSGLVTSELFDFYFDCVSDARENGYYGPLPSGPKVPLSRAPARAARTKRAPAAGAGVRAPGSPG